MTVNKDRNKIDWDFRKFLNPDSGGAFVSLEIEQGSSTPYAYLKIGDCSNVIALEFEARGCDYKKGFEYVHSHLNFKKMKTRLHKKVNNLRAALDLLDRYIDSFEDE